MTPSSPALPSPVGGVTRYRGYVQVRFSAALRISGLEPGSPAGRLHGHDYTATFWFEAITLVYPGVVVDDDMRAEVIGRVSERYDHRDLDRLLNRPATCEAIADALASWYMSTALPPGHAHLVAVTVATGDGQHAEIHLPSGNHS